jgi:mono/diheme cytochrome c family protein
MKRQLILLAIVIGMAGCAKQALAPTPAGAAAPEGAVLMESSGGKQAAAIGTPLEQPVMVQLNDAKGAAAAGVGILLSGPTGAKFDPPSGVTDANGQFTSQVAAPGTSGHFQIVAATADGKARLKIDGIALGYEQGLGRQLSTQYCARCHDAESTPERVSNMDNLDPKPHAFSEGDTYNKISNADLTSLISHGGAALNKSASMPPFGYTLTPAEIQALISYIRAIADPPYERVYANK